MDKLADPQPISEIETQDTTKFFENLRSEILDKLCIELGLVSLDADGDYEFSHYSLLIPIREAFSKLDNVELPELMNRYRIELGLVSLDEDYGYNTSLVSKLFGFDEILGLDPIEEGLEI